MDTQQQSRSRKSSRKGGKSKPRSQWIRKDRPEEYEFDGGAAYTDHLEVERQLQAKRAGSGRSQKRRRQKQKARRNGQKPKPRRERHLRHEVDDSFYDKRYPRGRTEYSPLYEDEPPFFEMGHEPGPLVAPYPLYPSHGPVPTMDDAFARHSPPDYRGASAADDYDGSAETPVYEPVRAPDGGFEMDEDVKDAVISEEVESPPAKVYRLKPLKQPVRPIRPARGRYAPPFAPDAYTGTQHLDRLELWNNDYVRRTVTDMIRRELYQSRGMDPRLLKKGRRKEAVTEDEAARRKREAAADEEEAALKAEREAAKKRMQKERLNRITDVLRYLFSEHYLKTESADYMKGLMDESEGWIKVRYLVSVREMRELFHSSSVEGKPPRAQEIQKALKGMTKDLELTEDCTRVRRRRDWARYMLDPEAEQGLSKRALEAITYRVEDYHAKRAYYKAKAAAKRKREEEERVRKEEEERDEDHTGESGMQEAQQQDDGDDAGGVATGAAAAPEADGDAADPSRMRLIDTDLQSGAVRAAGIDPSLDQARPTLSFTDRGDQEESSEHDNDVEDDDQAQLEDEEEEQEEHIPHISFS